VAEKNTVQSVVHKVAMRYTMPYTIGRGYCSIDRRHAMAQRFRQSGKQRLVLLFLTDFDPDGREISRSFARSARDDFGVNTVVPVQVALTAEQVESYGLPPSMKAKVGSAHYKKFVEQHGENVYELEALNPGQLEHLLRAAVDKVIDRDALQAEINNEEQDAAFLAAVRRRVKCALEEWTE